MSVINERTPDASASFSTQLSLQYATISFRQKLLSSQSLWRYREMAAWNTRTPPIQPHSNGIAMLPSSLRSKHNSNGRCWSACLGWMADRYTCDNPPGTRGQSSPWADVYDKKNNIHMSFLHRINHSQSVVFINPSTNFPIDRWFAVVDFSQKCWRGKFNDINLHKKHLNIKHFGHIPGFSQHPWVSYRFFSSVWFPFGDFLKWAPRLSNTEISPKYTSKWSYFILKMVIFMGYSMVFRKPGPILGHLTPPVVILASGKVHRGLASSAPPARSSRVKRKRKGRACMTRAPNAAGQDFATVGVDNMLICWYVNIVSWCIVDVCWGSWGWDKHKNWISMAYQQNINRTSYTHGIVNGN